MSTESRTSARRGRLGAALRDARLAAGMTQARAAAALGCRQGKINKIETTHCAISPRDLHRLVEIYSPTDDLASRISVLSVQDGPGVPAGTRLNPSFLRLLELEPTATEILSLHSERLPGLLQSEYYMLSQFARAKDPTDVATLLYDRQERARLFTIDDPPRFNAILSESSLHRMPGGRGPGLVIDQAQHLLTLGETHERVAIQILTFDADIPFLDTDFTVLRFGGRQQDLAYVEYATAGRIFRSARAVADRVRYWNLLHRAALGIEDSRKFIEDLIEQARAELKGR